MSGKSQAEIAAEAEKAKKREEALKAAAYDLDKEHLIEQEELAKKLDTEMQHAIGGDAALQGFKYAFDRRDGKDKHVVISQALRKILTEDFTRLNVLTPAYQKPEWLKFVEELTGFFALLLWFGSILCFVGYGLRKEVDNLYLGIVLAVVVLITGIFSYAQNAKSASLMAQFAKLLANAVAVATDQRRPLKSDLEAGKARDWNEWINNDPNTWEFDSKYLVRGDVLKLKSGNKVPADIRVIKSSNLKVDNSSLTGESDALERGPNNHETDPKEATNMIFFGTNVEEGTCEGVVLRTGDGTFIGKIAQLTESTAAEQTPINKEIHHFIKIVSAVAIFLGVGFFIIGLALGTDFITNLVFMIGIIVANVPEGLLATVTVVLTLTSQKMHSKNVLVKNMEGVETLGSTTAICSDKTGTLTQNKMTFSELLFDKQIFRTEFVEGSRDGKGFPLLQPNCDTFTLFHKAMCLNTTAVFQAEDVNGAGARPFYQKATATAVPAVQWNTEGDASESSIIKFAQYMFPNVWSAEMPSDASAIQQLFNQDLVSNSRKSGFPDSAAAADGAAAAAAAGAGAADASSAFEEAGKIPFNSRNKYHVHITANNLTPDTPYTVWIKGAPERIMGRCDQHIVDGQIAELTPADREEIDALQRELMAKGRRVLAFAKYDMTPEEVPECQADDEGAVPKHPFAGDAKNFPMGENPNEEEKAKHLDTLRRNGKDKLAAGYEALAHKRLTFIGMAALIDPPRPAVPSAVLSCQRAGIRVVMVTGDHPETAAAIARMVNIFTTDKVKRIGPVKAVIENDGGEVEVTGQDGHIMTKSIADPCLVNRHGDDVSQSRSIVVPGWEINEATSDEKWRFIFSHDEVVFARTSPAQKLQIVQRFQDMENDIVAVTGDGVNDAPALKKADIGIAMGIAGTEVSKTAADMILIDDNFASIVKGVEEGRLIFDNLKKSIAYTLSSNIPEIAPFLVFITVQTPLPLSTVLILCIDLGTDMVPAISMAWEAAEADIMSRPARDSNVDRLVTKKLVVFAYLQIGMVQAAAGFFTWLVVLNDYGYPPSILPGLGANNNWGTQVLFCQLEGGVYRNIDGEAYTSTVAADAFDAGYYFWDPSEDGSVEGCDFAARVFTGESDSAPSGFDQYDPSTYGDYTDGEAVVTSESIDAMHAAGYVEYYPYRARMSPFWQDQWLAWDMTEADVLVKGAGDSVNDKVFFNVQLPGVFSIDTASATGDDAVASKDVLEATADYFSDTLNLDVSNPPPMYGRATFQQPTAAGETIANSYTTMDAAGAVRTNIASRMMQSEALQHAQCAYFVTIVVVQWADLMICKTRWLSIYHQGMVNPAMNFGLIFETLLASLLCYVPGIGNGLGTRPIRLLHWVPAVPFSICIVLYDEARKAIMRATSERTMQGMQVLMKHGWMARNTYY